MLTEAQNELERTKEILTKEQAAELEDQIAEMEDQIKDLNDQLAEVSVVDISNYAVTMEDSYPYTGKAIEPAIKVSGLNEPCYIVSFDNNTEIGTASVTIKAAGDKYKGTYTVKITVKAAGDKNHNSLAKTVSVKVKVK